MLQLKKIDKTKLPVYSIVVDEFDESGINLISLVDKPAIEMKGMTFNQDKTIQMEFKKIDGDKQIIIGPALIPDMKIYRENAEYGQHYVEFTKEVISKLVQKFNKTGSNRKINLEHSNQMVDAFIIEDWIVEDQVYDKSRKYGFEVPVGTYMIMVKIENKDFWETEVKGNGKFGFSIEGLLGQVPMRLSIEDDFTIDDLELEDLLEIFELAGEPGMVHPNCSCSIVGGEFKLSADPCELCLEAAAKWDKSGKFTNVFDTEYNKKTIGTSTISYFKK